MMRLTVINRRTLGIVASFIKVQIDALLSTYLTGRLAGVAVQAGLLEAGLSDGAVRGRLKS